jgi:recombination protein RecA
MAVARKRLKAPEATEQEGASASSYFASGAEKKGINFLSTGCAIMDEVLGGGYPLGRVTNIVGDRSTGKTLLAIEACANFKKQFPDGYIRYAEAEAAFDKDYASALGLPVDDVNFAEDDEAVFTVEDFYEDLVRMLDKLKGRPAVYVLDSLDALSDRAEQERKIDEGSFGGNKPKKMGEIFRRLIAKLKQSNVLVIVISQLRDKIGVSFGETKTRSGGKALDFYASQIIWLSQKERLDRTIDGVKRVIGIEVRMQTKKNKVGLPFRECDFPILFGYGVDDLTANVEWVIEGAKKEELLTPLGFTKAGYKVRLLNMRNKGGEPVRELRAQLAQLVRDEWRRIEQSFLPKTRKY